MRRFPTERVFDEVQIFEDLPVEIRKASHFTRARIASHVPEPIYTHPSRFTRVASHDWRCTPPPPRTAVPLGESAPPRCGPSE
jgi:hypothetical protein